MSCVSTESNQQKRLYIIDGFAQIFRAYYAIRKGIYRPITNEPANALFGFAAMLFKLISVYKPDYLLVALDSPGPTHRDKLYPDYKATRSITPPELMAQVPWIIEMLGHFNIPSIAISGLEADDIIATIVQRVCVDEVYTDVVIHIASKDKDLEQLISDRVVVCDVHTGDILTQHGLLDKKGIRPNQVADYLAIIGDSVDNIPGIPGIGPKTAVQLLQQFVSIDNILEHADEVPMKLRQKFLDNGGSLSRSRKLVELVSDGDFEFDLELARVSQPNVNSLVNFFKEMGFHRFQNEARKLDQLVMDASLTIE